MKKLSEKKEKSKIENTFDVGGGGKMVQRKDCGDVGAD